MSQCFKALLLASFLKDSWIPSTSNLPPDVDSGRVVRKAQAVYAIERAGNTHHVNLYSVDQNGKSLGVSGWSEFVPIVREILNQLDNRPDLPAFPDPKRTQPVFRSTAFSYRVSDAVSVRYDDRCAEWIKQREQRNRGEGELEKDNGSGF